jgi:type VI secretion system secreted protein VgrG
VPRIGQEVVVSFLEGDPDQPLITGSVYNGTNAPPFAPQTTPQISGIKTDSTKNATGFNELSFDDTKSAELINIRAQKNLAASSENDTTCSAKRNIAIDATKQLQLTAGTQAELKATGALTVDGKTVLLTAAEELKLRVGLAEISLNAAGIISIKGTFVTATGKNLLIVSESKGLMRGMIVVPV